MFRKPQINISLSRQAKTAAPEETITESVNKIDWERINTAAQATIKKTAIVLVAAYAAKTAIDTTSEIAIHAATTHIR